MPKEPGLFLVSCLLVYMLAVVGLAVIEVLIVLVEKEVFRHGSSEGSRRDGQR